MKILIYGLPRTRSTYLSDILRRHYTLNNYFEPYHTEITDPIDKIYYRNQLNEKWQTYLNSCQDVTNKLKSEDNFILKIFPQAIYNVLGLQNNNFCLSQSDLLPFIKFYNIGMYDQIYVTSRENKIDWLCSLLHAKNNNTFLFTNINKAKFYAPKNIKLEYNNTLQIFAFNELLYEYGLKILKRHMTNIIELEYNEIPNYVADEFPNIKSDFIDPNYNYKNNIINYEEIKLDYEKVKKDSCIIAAKDFLDNLLSQ